MDASAEPVREREPPRPLALLLWAGLAGLQIAVAFSLADPERAEEKPPIYEWSTAASALVVYGLLLLLTFAIASLYPTARSALGVTVPDVFAGTDLELAIDNPLLLERDAPYRVDGTVTPLIERRQGTEIFATLRYDR